MNDVNEMTELARRARETLADRLIDLNPEYLSLKEGEREILKQNILGVIVDVQSKYRLVKSGKATEEQLFDWLDLFGESGSLSYMLADAIRDLSDREDEALCLANEINKLEEDASKATKETNKQKAYIAKEMLKQKKYYFEDEYCDVLLSWLSAVENEDKQRVYEASETLFPILVEIISEQHTFKVKRGRGKSLTDPKHEEKFVYAKRYGDKAAAEKFNQSEESIRIARFKVKDKYSPKELQIIECFRLQEIYLDEISNEKMTYKEINQKFNEIKILQERVKHLLSLS